MNTDAQAVENLQADIPDQDRKLLSKKNVSSQN